MRLDKFDKILDEEQTREWIKPELSRKNGEQFSVASAWLADLLDEREKSSGYQYNADFQEWICKREKWTADNISLKSLSTAIYNAQCHRTTRKILAAGFGYLTTEMIKSAIATGKKIVIHGESMLGGKSIVEGRPIITANGEGFVLAPRSRKSGWGINSLTIAKIAA